MESARYLLVVAVVFAMFFSMIEAYGSGAPTRACAGAQPIHATVYDGSPVVPLDPAYNPYRFTFDAEEYIPGEDLEVTISEASGGMINGFFLQARRTDNVVVGTFREPLPNGAQIRQCTEGDDDDTPYVTHTNPTGKSGLTFTWRAPPRAGNGNITFVGAVAIDHDNFYGGMTSAVIAEGSAVKLSSGFGLLLVSLFISIRQCLG